MKISYNWLKEYLPIDLAPTQVGEILTGTGLEVEGIEKVEQVEGGLAGIVVGLVKTAEQHPNADRLRVTTVDVGGEEDLPIVCGAPNVAAGQKVVVATVGSTLYPTSGESFKIKKSKIRGEVSMGMICAEDEIGLGTDHDGIIVLPETATIGQAAKEVFDLKEDYIFEIGLTPNRSDATNHVGVAKDLAAALQTNHNSTQQVQLPSVDAFQVANETLPIVVEVKNTTSCPRYAGVSITGVTVKPSPDWMQQYLQAIGVRPINNIVDITNFILHELGQPLHAFDADKITGGKVIVQNLPTGSPFVTLDEQERKLHADDLMICDGEGKGMCIAGVFGGIHSGVTDTTTSIFLESACFEAINTRKTATRHDLRTDAAIRFEKGVDPNNTLYALKRAALLICEFTGGQIASQIVDIYPQKIEKPIVSLRFARVNKLIGVAIPPAEVKQILVALEMDIIEETEEGLKVAVGTNRADVLREIDLIEEVLRIYGFNKVPISQSLKSAISYSPRISNYKVKNKIGDFLASNGYYEMMANSITNAAYYSEEETGVVKLLNSMNAHLDALRHNMLFSGLEAIRHNQNYKTTDLRLFEFGRTFHTYEANEQTQYEEQEHLTIFLSGMATPESWQGKQQAYTFFDIKEICLQILHRLGINSYQTASLDSPYFSYGLAFKQGKKRPLVQFGAVKNSIGKQFGIKKEVYYADFHWDNILAALKNVKIKFQEIPKYPNVRRDLALLLDQQVTFEQIAQIAAKSAKHLLRNVNLFDIFEDEAKVGKGKKSYAVSFIFQDALKTMTDKEIDKTMQKLMHNFKEKLGAEIR